MANPHNAAKTEKPAENTPKKKIFDFAFGRENYILMIAGILVLAIGYLLLTGGGSKNPEVFSYELFNTRRLVIAPLVILCGFIIEIFAIMKKPRQ